MYLLFTVIVSTTLAGLTMAIGATAALLSAPKGIAHRLPFHASIFHYLQRLKLDDA